MATVAQAQVLQKRPSSAARILPSLLHYGAKQRQEEYERDKARRMSEAMVRILEQSKTETPVFNPSAAALPSGADLGDTEPLVSTETRDIIPDKVKASAIFHRMVPDATSVEMNQFSTYLDNLFAEQRALERQLNATKVAQGAGIDVDLGTAPIDERTQAQIISAKATQAAQDREQRIKVTEGQKLLALLPPAVQQQFKGASIDTIKPLVSDLLIATRQAAADEKRDERDRKRIDAQADRLEKSLKASEARLDKRLSAQEERTRMQIEAADARAEAKRAADAPTQFDQSVDATWKRLQTADPSITRDQAVYVERNRGLLDQQLTREFGKQLQGGIFEILEDQKLPYGLAQKMAERMLAKGGTVGEASVKAATRARIAVQSGQIVPKSVWATGNKDGVLRYLQGTQGLSEDRALALVQEWDRSGVFRRQVNAALAAPVR